MVRNEPGATRTEGLSAVFLDRDGVVLDLVEYLCRKEDMRLGQGIAQAIRTLNERGIPVVIVTNQSAVARGLISEAGLLVLHRHMTEMLAAEGAKVDAIYYCPHHPQAGEPPYRTVCSCRKPEPGMILQAAADLGVDLSHSILIGDTLSDIDAAHRAGVGRAILVRTGYGAKEEARLPSDDRQPDAVQSDAATAIAEALKRPPVRASVIPG